MTASNCKLVILIPRGAHRAPILLSRTPYGATERVSKNSSAHLAALIDSTDVADDAVESGGYIRVMQDVRGKHGSEGDYVMTRPLRGPLNPTAVDHSTDTYDTIDWLVKNIPESNGKVGILGISYDGFTSLMALVNPHPALRAAVPINAMVDGWRGDDWFHNGAFRLDSLTYFHGQEASRDSDIPWWTDHYDDYDTWLSAGSAGEMARLHGLEQVGFTDKVMSHPAYDAFWQDQALDKILAKQGVTVPVMLVHSLWDQEDIYGNIALYKALKARQADNPNLYLVIGPWFHHQERLDGSAIGQIRFGSDTARYFRLHVLRPFLDHYLKDDAPPLTLSPGHRLRDRHESLAGTADLAERLPVRLRHRASKSIPAGRRRLAFRFVRCRGFRVRVLCLRSGKACAVLAAAHPYRRRRGRDELADVAGERPARRGIAHRRLELQLRGAERAGENQRSTHRQSHRLDHRDGRRFRGEIDRRLSG